MVLKLKFSITEERRFTDIEAFVKVIQLLTNFSTVSAYSV